LALQPGIAERLGTAFFWSPAEVNQVRAQHRVAGAGMPNFSDDLPVSHKAPGTTPLRIGLPILSIVKHRGEHMDDGIWGLVVIGGPLFLGLALFIASRPRRLTPRERAQSDQVARKNWGKERIH
jgi:hypothetical protein